eukprot:4190335-Ditylum_brightwellii.AAC.1
MRRSLQNMQAQSLAKPHHSEQNDTDYFQLQDNKGIVKRINDQLTYTSDYPFNTLETDWDIVAQAAHTLKAYVDTLTITQIKSHQDDNSLLEELSLPARLNVAADHLATSYSIQHGVFCVEVPRMLINYTQLYTKSGVISSH